MMEIELKSIYKGETFRTIQLYELPDEGDEIHFDTYPGNGPLVEEIYEVLFSYKVFKSTKNTRYIAIVKML
jgi:hypothetical protein